MKMVRRFLTVVLLMALCIGMKSELAQAAATLPQNLQYIADEAFYGDTSLDYVTVPDGCRSIGTRAFADCGIKEITMPATVSYIASDAFEGNSGMLVIADFESYAYDWAITYGFKVRLGSVKNLQANAYENRDVVLSWENVKGATGYRISEVISGGKTVLGTASSIPCYEMKDVAAGTHTYAVEAYRTVDGETTYGADAEVSVTLQSISVQRIALSESYVELEVGDTCTLTATVYPENAENKAVAWTSDNPDVASVNQSGRVTALGSGVAAITVSARDGSGVSASAIVQVNADETPYLTVTHPDIGDVLNAGEIVMHNNKAYQTWSVNSNYASRVEAVGEWFTLSKTADQTYEKTLNLQAGENTVILFMDDGTPAGTKRTGKVRFYINNSLFVEVNICQIAEPAESVAPEPSISVSHLTLGNVFEAGTFEMWNASSYQTWSVTANCNWRITTSGNWFTVSRTSGTAGTSQIRLDIADGVGPGESRTGSVTFYAEGKLYKTVSFQQVGPEKSLSISHVEIGDIIHASPIEMFNGAAHQTWTINSNAPWTLKTVGTWYTVSQKSGPAGTTTITLNFPNGAPAGETRTGSLKFYFGSELYTTVQIVQDGAMEETPDDSISVVHLWAGDVLAAGSLNLTNSSYQSMTLTVYSSFDWTITTTGSWFKVEPDNGDGGEVTQVKITTLSYAPSGYNSGKIVFKKGGSTKATIQLYQGTAYLPNDYDDSFSVSHKLMGNVLDQDTVSIHNNSGTQHWYVVSNVDWTLTQSGDWFDVYPKSGDAKTNTEVKLTFYDGVGAGESREGYVKFTYYINGRKKTKKVYLVQSAEGEIEASPSLAASHQLLGDVFAASPIALHNSVGAVQNWSITSNRTWRIETSGDWFTVSRTTGSANTASSPTTNLKITTTGYALPGSYNSGSITFYVDGMEARKVRLYQDAGQEQEPTISIGSSEFGNVLNAASITLKNAKQTYAFAVKANRAWSVTKSGSWFSISQTSGTAEQEYTLKLAVNQLPTAGQTLTGSLTFKLEGKTYQTIQLKIVSDEPTVVAPSDTKLPAPTNVMATATSATTAKLTWSAVSGARGYNVYRGTSVSGSFTKVNTSLVTATAYTDSKLVAGVDYFYYVEAVSSSNVAGSGSILVGPVSYHAACTLKTVSALAFSADGEIKTVTVTKHGSNDFTVSIQQYNSDGQLCSASYVTDSDHKRAPWLAATKTRNEITVRAAQNYAATGKTAVITIQCACGASHTITVQQAAAAPAPASASMTLKGYNGFTETSTVRGKETANHLDYILVPGDSITVAASAGNNARRLTVRVLNGKNEVVLDEFSTTTSTSGLSKTCTYAIPENASGVYTIQVYASNSTVAGDDARWISASAKIMVNVPQAVAKQKYLAEVARIKALVSSTYGHINEVNYTYVDKENNTIKVWGFGGYGGTARCGTYVGKQAVDLGFLYQNEKGQNYTAIGYPDGKMWYTTLENGKIIRNSKDGKLYQQTKYSGENCLQAIVDANGGEPVYNIIVSYERWDAASNYTEYTLYGHARYIYAILKDPDTGKYMVYFSDNMTSYGGVSEGNMVTIELDQFCPWSKKYHYEFIGAIYFKPVE